MGGYESKSMPGPFPSNDDNGQSHGNETQSTGSDDCEAPVELPPKWFVIDEISDSDSTGNVPQGHVSTEKIGLSNIITLDPDTQPLRAHHGWLQEIHDGNY